MPDLQAIPELLLPAFALTIVGLSFGAGVAQTFPSPEGRVGNPSRDFLGQGVANFVSAFFQCMPSAGSMSRTAYLVEAGATTRWVHVFTGLAMLGIVLIAADLAARIPLAVVAGLLIVLGYTAIDFDRVRLVWRINRTERWTLIVTAALTLVMSPPLAILAGVFLSFVSFVQASANTVALARLVRSDDGLFDEGAPPDGFASDAVTALRVHGPLFFFRRRRQFRASAAVDAGRAQRRARAEPSRLYVSRQHRPFVSRAVRARDAHVRQSIAAGGHLGRDSARTRTDRRVGEGRCRERVRDAGGPERVCRSGLRRCRAGAMTWSNRHALL
jgi:SulP family sulfate permease